MTIGEGVSKWKRGNMCYLYAINMKIWIMVMKGYKDLNVIQ